MMGMNIGWIWPKKGRRWPVIDQSANIPIRGLMLEINAEFERILENSDTRPQLVNAGAKPLDGTGETMTEGLTKIRDNLKRITRQCECT